MQLRLPSLAASTAAVQQSSDLEMKVRAGLARSPPSGGARVLHRTPPRQQRNWMGHADGACFDATWMVINAGSEAQSHGELTSLKLQMHQSVDLASIERN